jgi:acyl-CoA synthetase (AMP-forming)/AMP-acid ligase II
MTGLLHDVLDSTTAPAGRSVISGKQGRFDAGELRAASLRASTSLVRHGVRRGDRVVCRMPNDPRIAALLFGASRIGAAVAVVHEEVRGTPLRHILDDCAPRLLVTIEPEPGTPSSTMEELLAGPATKPAGPAPLAVDPVLLIYTSGTTALPKAVVSTHEQVLFAACAIQSYLGYRTSDVVYSPLPISFDYGLYQVFLSLLGGAHLVLGDATDAGAALLRTMVRAQATVLPAVPPVAVTLLRLARRAPQSLPPLRLMTNTGAAMSRDVLAGLRALLPDLRVQLMFGLTECKRVAIMEPDGDLARPDAVGKPLPGTEVFTVDERGRRLPDGEPGELVIRGPHVMAGYWRRPKLTAQRFPRAEGLFPQLRSGDWGWLDEDGYLHFLGRRDDIYKQCGFRVSSIEVEAAARRVDGVAAAAVLPPTAQCPVAALVVTGPVEADKVVRALSDELESFKVPGECVVVPELPSNANGKVDKKALAAMLREAVDV